jgi:RNA polymerase sigma-70 factor (ECF subfamily)
VIAGCADVQHLFLSCSPAPRHYCRAVSSVPPPLRLVEPNAVPGEGPEPDMATTAYTLDSAFRTYSAYVAAIGLRLLGRSEEIDDLVQDVFVRASRGLGALREPAALKGWLATITVRVAQRRLRGRAVWRVLRLDTEYDYRMAPTPGCSPEQRAMLAETFRLLDTIPARERLAWSLRHLEGESLERIAELTRASLATVKRRIAAAGARLAELADG